MLKIELVDIPSLKTNGLKVSEQITKNQKAALVLAQQSNDSNVTVPYVLKQITEAEKLCQAVNDYVLSNTAAIINPLSSSGRTELAKKVEALLQAYSDSIDYEQLRADNQSSIDSVQLLISTFEQFQSLLPKQKLDCLVQSSKKLKQILRPAQTPETPDTWDDLFAYISQKKNEISKIEAFNERIASYQSLHPVILNISDVIQSDDYHYENWVTVQACVPKIIFDEIDGHMKKHLLDFEIQIKRLERRSRQTSPLHAEQTYSPAIRDAKQFMSDINQARNAYQQHLDFDIFRNSVSKIFERYENCPSFNINRSKFWFKNFIQLPFEKLKVAINQVLSLITRKEIVFFKPAKTTTKKEFEALQNNLLDIGQDKPKQPKT